MRACVILALYLWCIILFLFIAPGLYELQLYSVLLLSVAALVLAAIVIVLALLPDRHTKE